MYRLLILLIVLQFKLIGQETEVIKNTKVYLYPNSSKNSVIGEIFPGSLVTKLKKDKSGKFIKATIEFYIPVEALLEGRVSHPVGTTQIADNAKYKLIEADQTGTQVILKLRVANINPTKELDFSAMVLLKAIGKGNNKGELNPFQGRYQDLAIIAPLDHVIAELTYNFKSKPKNVELVCTGKMGGDRVYYTLGF
jgi:hypothetical protein|tara:strand:+ start:220 stop:804 length:585 start_codon:yes stop_codon:yes gene_type:complete